MAWQRWNVDLEIVPTVARASHVGHYVRAIRKIGSITLLWWKYGKAGGYEVWDDEVCIGHGRYLWEALRRARERKPKTIKRTTTEQEGGIIAFRGWRLLGDCLAPITWRGSPDDPTANPWTGPVARAEIHCESSGLWAVKLNKNYMKQVLNRYFPDAHGFVELSGTVIEHERGYRATVAAIRLIRIEHAFVSDAYIALLEDRYQCQVLRVKPGEEW